MPKKTYNEVLYLDNHLAVYDDKGAHPSTAEMVSRLLQIGTNEQNPLKPINELLTCCGTPVKYANYAPNAQLSDVNAEKLHELGYTIIPASRGDVDGLQVIESFEGDSPFADHPYGGDEIGRYLVSLDSLNKLANVLRYFASLALLSQGDMRSRDAISMRLDNGSRTLVHFEATIPLLGDGFRGEWINEKVFSILGYGGFAVDVIESEPALKVNCSISRNGYYGTIPRDLDGRTKLAANYLLSAVYCAATGVGFEPDSESGLPKSINRGVFFQEIIDAARSGRLEGCPRCGWPVLRLTDKADRYCRKGHRTKTDKEKKRNEAREMLRSGKSVEEVVKAFRKGKGYFFTERQIKLLEKQINQEQREGR